jgi:hypothetical protein
LRVRLSQSRGAAVRVLRADGVAEVHWAWATPAWECAVARAAIVAKYPSLASDIDRFGPIVCAWLTTQLP